MGDPPFQRINGGWQAIVAVTPRPRPCGLDGAEQGVEMIRAGVIGQAVWRFHCQAMGWLDTVFVDEVKYFHSRFVLLPGLFGFAVLLVALATDQASGQNAGIRFDDDPSRVTLLQAVYRDTGFFDAWRAFKEHQADRCSIKLLRADGSGGDIGCAAMLLVSCGAVFAVVIQCGAKALASELFGMIDIALPGIRPADGLDESPGLPEWEVDPGDPWARLSQGGLECREVPPLGQITRAEMSVFKHGFQAGDGFAALRAAGEINAVNNHASIVALLGPAIQNNSPLS